MMQPPLWILITGTTSIAGMQQPWIGLDSTAKLREREARLEAILDNAADAIITVGHEGRLMSGNAAAGAIAAATADTFAWLLERRPAAEVMPQQAGVSAAGTGQGAHSMEPVTSMQHSSAG